MIYVIPDTHLGHENIKKYCNRPENFEALIEKNWRAAISETDTVIHLGDVSFDEKLERAENFSSRQPRQKALRFLFELRVRGGRRGISYGP